MAAENRIGVYPCSIRRPAYSRTTADRSEFSGLPVMQYDPDSLHDEFGPAFELIEHDDESHVTPAGRVQHFIYCHCIKPH